MVYFHRMFSDSSYKIGSLYHSPSEGCCLRQGEIPEQSIQKCDLSLFVLQNEERGWVLQQKNEDFSTQIPYLYISVE